MIQANPLIKSLAVFTDTLDTVCPRLRILAPAQVLGWKVLRGLTEKSFNPRVIESGDIVVIQRDYFHDIPTFDRVLQLAHQRQIPMIFEMDDLLFELPSDHPDRQSGIYADSLLPMLIAVIESDLVTVTTPLLRDYLLPFTPNIRVLPNYLDDLIWKIKPPKVQHNKKLPVSIGYMGTNSHEPDLQEVLPALLQIAQKFSEKIIFRFWGIQPPQELMRITKVDWVSHPTYTYSDFVKYFQTQSADIIIAPLRDNLFNSCKSPLKFFEYSANAMPGVYSRVPAYEGVINDGQEGLLASTTEEWVNALSMMIESPELREKIIRNAQSSIQSKWLLSRNIGDYRDTYLETLSGVRKEKQYSHVTPLLRNIANQLYEGTLIKQREQDKLLDEKEQLFQNLPHEYHVMEQELNKITQSTSWKITRPLRKLRRLFRRAG